MSEYLDFISIDFWHIVMSIGNLVILTFILKRFLFEPVNNILSQREQEVKKIYGDAESALISAESRKEIYAEKLSSAKDESEEILKLAVKTANDHKQQIIKDAELRVSRILSRAENDIELKHKKALRDMKEEITGMVVMLAEKVVEKEIDPKVHDEIINTAIEQLCKG